MSVSLTSPAQAKPLFISVTLLLFCGGRQICTLTPHNLFRKISSFMTRCTNIRTHFWTATVVWTYAAFMSCRQNGKDGNSSHRTESGVSCNIPVHWSCYIIVGLFLLLKWHLAIVSYIFPVVTIYIKVKSRRKDATYTF